MPMPQTSLSQAPPLDERDLIIFSGAPHFVDGRALLCDTSGDEKGLPARTRLTQVRVEFTQGDSVTFDVNRTEKSPVRLLIFVGDLTEPRATVRLHDLVCYGERPLNLQREVSDIVRVELVDSDTMPCVDAMKLTVMLILEQTLYSQIPVQNR